MIHPEIQLPLAHALIDEKLAWAENERLAQRARLAAPNLVRANRWRDSAFWASIIGPVFGLGFLAYFAQELGRAALQ
jgi:hypothetical protein